MLLPLQPHIKYNASIAQTLGSDQVKKLSEMLSEANKRHDVVEQDLESARFELESVMQQLAAEGARATEAETRAKHEWEERVALHQRDLAQKDEEIAALVCWSDLSVHV